MLTMWEQGEINRLCRQRGLNSCDGWEDGKRSVVVEFPFVGPGGRLTMLRLHYTSLDEFKRVIEQE